MQITDFMEFLMDLWMQHKNYEAKVDKPFIHTNLPKQGQNNQNFEIRIYSSYGVWKTCFNIAMSSDEGTF